MIITLGVLVVALALVIIIGVAVGGGRPRERDVCSTLEQTSAAGARAWTDAVELGVAVIRAMPEADDGEIIDRLESIGVAPWLAARLVMWVPAAFAERVLTSTTFLETYSEGATQRRLSDDPIWTAARARAETATSDEAMDVASRSAAMNAVRAYLASDAGRGKNASEVEGRTATALVAPLPAVVPGDGGVPEPRAAIAALLEAHGVTIVPTQTTAAGAGELEVDALVVRHAFLDGFRAQVDFVARHARLSDGSVVESFSASGPTYRAAMVEAIHKFERGTLHVLLAALVDETSCADQVDWEDWPHPSGGFRACIGAQLLLWDAPVVPVGALLDALRSAIAEAPLDRSVHAIRVFTAREGERSLADEVLLDGEPWPAGEALCRAHAWPVRDRPWATRVFLMLVPSPGSSSLPAPDER